MPVVAKSCFRLALAALVAVLVLTPTRAHADSYELINLGNDATQFYGMSATGLAVFDIQADSACGGQTCYFTYLNGVETGTSSIAPTFTLDDGTACSPSLPAGWSIYQAKCNNGRVVWTGTYAGNPPTEVYFNTTPTPPTGGPQFGGSVLYLDSIGDAIIDNGFNNDWYYAVDLSTLPATTTPEPSTLALLASGILTLAIIPIRRRFLLS